MSTDVGQRPNVIDRLTRRIVRRVHPKTLFHYTSLAGLQGILGSRGIYATDIWFLNDSTEFGHALEIADRALSGRAETAETDLETALYDVLRQSLSDVGDRHVFVTSFTKNHDQLSQWRGYCPSAKGYSIGFAHATLSRVARTQGALLAPCMYETDDKLRLIDSLVEDVLELVRHDDRTTNKNLERLLRDAHQEFARLLCLAAPVLKHESFREEQEWRLFSKPLLLAAADLSFRPGHSMFVPYRPLILWGMKERPPIEAVVVGPTPMPQLARRSVELLLASCGVRNANVMLSESPYRDW